MPDSQPIDPHLLPDVPDAGDFEITSQDALKLAVELHRRGRLGEAEMLYRSILTKFPEQPDALHFLGVLRHQVGQSDDAIGHLRAAIAILPEHADIHSNLGNVLKESGRLEEAEAAYREAIALRPEHADAHNNLGALLLSYKRLEEAERVLRRAIALREEDAGAWHNLGSALKKQGRVDEAIDAYKTAVRLRPSDLTAQLNLANSLYRVGQKEKAVAVLKEWLVFDAGNPFARHHLASLEGGLMPERASDAYIVGIFDNFATKFDRNLTSLEYRAPDLVAAEAARVAGPLSGRLDVLDAGCGTGLCAPLLRPLARSLVGVDLSPRMLDQARSRGGYDQVDEAELTVYLAAARDAWDLIVSADTLCYFGSLAPVMEAAAGALRPGGWIVFTLEKASPDTAVGGVRLNPHGRYSHTEVYVREIISTAGLVVLSIVEENLRNEGGKPVNGLVVTVRRPGQRSPRG